MPDRRLSPLGGRVRRRVRAGAPAPRPIATVIAAYAAAVPDATFVQVGAHDGTALDPLQAAIASSRWRGVMVEPVPYVFERLRATYGEDPRITLENVAVAEEDGTRALHHLAEATDGDDVWKWYDALGSFDREVVLRHTHLVPDIADRIVSTEVPCVTFDSLCARNGLDAFDVLQIDTEGYDHVVLGLVDLDRFHPALVMFENLHLEPAVHDACRARLAAHGYEDIADGMDTLAVHRDAVAAHRAVRRAWSRARR